MNLGLYGAALAFHSKPFQDHRVRLYSGTILQMLDDSKRKKFLSHVLFNQFTCPTSDPLIQKLWSGYKDTCIFYKFLQMHQLCKTD